MKLLSYFHSLYSRRRRRRWINIFDSSKMDGRERSLLYMIIIGQILLVIPFPFYLVYLAPKPKYVFPMFVIIAVTQLFPAMFNSNKRPIVFFCLCGTFLSLFEGVVFLFIRNV